MKANSLEEVIEYLNSVGIETRREEKEGDYNRVVEFTVEGTTYWIEWWVNQSYLKLQQGFSKPKLPFKYINVNTYSPTTLHHDHLCFYDVPEPNNGQFMYNEIPFGALRIPFNVKK